MEQSTSLLQETELGSLQASQLVASASPVKLRRVVQEPCVESETELGRSQASELVSRRQSGMKADLTVEESHQNIDMNPEDSFICMESSIIPFYANAE